jgi:hypothetical protein
MWRSPREDRICHRVIRLYRAQDLLASFFQRSAGLIIRPLLKLPLPHPASALAYRRYTIMPDRYCDQRHSRKPSSEFGHERDERYSQSPKYRSQQTGGHTTPRAGSRHDTTSGGMYLRDDPYHVEDSHHRSSRASVRADSPSGSIRGRGGRSRMSAEGQSWHCGK